MTSGISLGIPTAPAAVKQAAATAHRPLLAIAGLPPLLPPAHNRAPVITPNTLAISTRAWKAPRVSKRLDRYPHSEISGVTTRTLTPPPSSHPQARTHPLRQAHRLHLGLRTPQCRCHRPGRVDGSPGCLSRTLHRRCCSRTTNSTSSLWPAVGEEQSCSRQRPAEHWPRNQPSHHRSPHRQVLAQKPVRKQTRRHHHCRRLHHPQPGSDPPYLRLQPEHWPRNQPSHHRLHREHRCSATELPTVHRRSRLCYRMWSLSPQR